MPQRLVKMVHAGLSAGTAAMVGGELQDNVTAAGSTQATATNVYGDIVCVTTAAASTGVILGGETFSPGDNLQVTNLGANSLSVYPPVGGQINALGVNAAFAVAAGKSALITARSSTAFLAALSA